MRYRLLGIAVLVGLLAGMVMLRPSGAQAIPGRADYYGYFGNQFKACGVHVLSNFPAAVPDTVNSAASFEALIVGKLNGAGQDRTGAEFIILTMTGHPAGSARVVAHDPAVIADWENRVETYAANGWVNWGEDYSFIKNTYYMSNDYTDGSVLPQSFCAGPNFDDVAGLTESSWRTMPSVVFHNPGDGDYAIKKDCGNPVGDMAPLSSADYNMGVSILAPSSVQPGDTFTATISVRNTGDANSELGLMQVASWGEAAGLPATGCTAAPGVAGCDLSKLSFWNATENNFMGSGVSKGYNNAGAGTFPVAPNPYWYWWVNPLSYPGTGFLSGASGTVTIQVKPYDSTPGYYPRTVPLCAYFTKKNRAGGYDQYCTNIQIVAPPRYPQLQARNGDIHAGGGLCGTAPASGNIKGMPQNQSFVDYVASAAGSINDFGSNGSTSGGTALSLGRTGGYAKVCRPDLYVEAKRYHDAQPSYHTLPGTGSLTVDVGNYPGPGQAMDGVWFYDGTELILKGTVSKKLTIVAAHDVRFVSDVALTPASSARAVLPSLGVIANGDINIAPTASRVEGYLFANGTIDTCSGGGPACNNILTINGFLMANALSFGRLGSANSVDVQRAEIVTLTPELYLNPPMFFDSASVDSVLQGQGEKAPLY